MSLHCSRFVSHAICKPCRWPRKSQVGPSAPRRQEPAEEHAQATASAAPARLGALTASTHRPTELQHRKPQPSGARPSPCSGTSVFVRHTSCHRRGPEQAAPGGATSMPWAGGCSAAGLEAAHVRAKSGSRSGSNSGAGHIADLIAMTSNVD